MQLIILILNVVCNTLELKKEKKNLQKKNTDISLLINHNTWKKVDATLPSSCSAKAQNSVNNTEVWMNSCFS